MACVWTSDGRRSGRTGASPGVGPSPVAVVAADEPAGLAAGRIAAVGTVGFTLLLYYGMRLVPGAVRAIVMVMTPAVTAAGAVLFLHDRLDRWKAFGLALAVAGAAGVNLGAHTGKGSSVLLGSVFVVGAVCCEAAYTLLAKRRTAQLSPLQVASLAAALAGLLFAPAAVVQVAGFGWRSPVWTGWATLVWWGARTMGLGTLLWFRGMARASASTASGFMAVMPVSALLLSYVLLGEAFAWIRVAGMAAVVSGIAAVAYGGKDRS